MDQPSIYDKYALGLDLIPANIPEEYDLSSGNWSLCLEFCRKGSTSLSNCFFLMNTGPDEIVTW